MNRGHDVRAVDIKVGRTVWGPRHPFASPADIMLTNGIVRAFMSPPGSPARIALWTFARDEWHYTGDLGIESAAIGTVEENFNADVLERADVKVLTTDEAVIDLAIRGAGTATVTLRRGDRGVRVLHGAPVGSVVTRQRRVAFYPAEVDLPAAIEPDEIDGLAAWYDADDISATVGGLVSTWPNSEGTAGRDLTASGADRPTYLGHVAASIGAVGVVASALSSASLAVTKPTGTVAGSLLLAFIDETTALGNPGGPSAGPAGWTKINQESGTNNTASSMWMLVAGGAEPADYTWTWNTARLVSGYIMRIEGFDPADPIDLVSGTQNSFADITALGLTPTNDDALMIVAGAKVSDDTLTPPAGWTERVDDSTQIGFTVVAASKTLGEGGVATGNVVLDMSGGSANYSTQSVTINALGDLYDLGHDHAAVRFSGAQRLKGSAFLTGSKGAVYAVMRFSDLSSFVAQVVLSSSDESTSTRYVSLSNAFATGIGVVQDNTETDDIVWSKLQVLGEDEWVMVGFASNGAEYELSVNGLRLGKVLVSGPDNGDWFGDTTSRDNTVVGARIRTTTDLFLTGDIAELWAYDGVEVTAEQEQGLFARAADRYNIDPATYGSALELGRRHATTTDEGAGGVWKYNTAGFVPVLATLSDDVAAGPGFSLAATTQSMEVVAFMADNLIGETPGEQHAQYAVATTEKLRVL